MTVDRLRWQDARNEFEREYFENLLKDAGGRVSRAARMAGVHRTEIYLRIEKFGINVNAIKAGLAPTKKSGRRRGFPTVVDSASRATYAVYAKYAEFAGYSEYAEFAMFANQERPPAKFLELAMEE